MLSMKNIMLLLSNKKPSLPIRKETPKAKWQAVYDAASSLRIFYSANESYLQGDRYQRLLEIISEKYHNLDIADYTNPQWTETSDLLSISGEFEHWVGHDETLYESIEMRFERLSKWDAPDEWSIESEWPCEGQYQYLDESVDKGDSWNYFKMTRKGWLLKMPFGLPGVWCFEYMSKHVRS